MRWLAMVGAAWVLSGCAGAQVPPPCDPVDAGPNDPSCPALWVDAQTRCLTREACTPGVPACGYVGGGDIVTDALGNECAATAGTQCVEWDAGVGEWRCAQ